MRRRLRRRRARRHAPRPLRLPGPARPARPEAIASGPDSHRQRFARGARRRSRRGRRRLHGKAVRARRALGASARPPPPGRAAGERPPRRRPGDGHDTPQRAAGRRVHRSQAEGICAARVPHAQHRSAGDAVAHHRARLGHSLRQRQQRRRGAHQLAAQQGRSQLPRAAHSHGEGCRLRALGRTAVTLTLRTRLAVISALVFGLLLTALSIVSYRLMALTLDGDVTARWAGLTDGVHGYLRFDTGAPVVAFDAADPDQAAFIAEATRYYRVFDADSGRLLLESDSFTPLGLPLAPADVQKVRLQPQRFDTTTDYGRLRISNSVIAAAGDRMYLLQVGIPLSAVDATLARYQSILFRWVPPAFLLAVLVSWWLSGFALMPLSRVAAAAREIDVATLDRRLPARAVAD